MGSRGSVLPRDARGAPPPAFGPPPQPRTPADTASPPARADGFPHQYVPMRMERQPREGEVLPNERARLLRPYSVINVELYDDAHITMWIRGTAPPPATP